MGNLAEVARFFDPEEAFCAQGFLRSRGIETFIQSEHHLTMAPWLRVALGGYRLMVFADETNNARTALEQINAVASAPVEDYGSRRNWAWFPLAFLMGFPFVLRYRSWQTLVLQIIVLTAFLSTFFLMFFV